MYPTIFHNPQRKRKSRYPLWWTWHLEMISTWNHIIYQILQMLSSIILDASEDCVLTDSLATTSLLSLTLRGSSTPTTILSALLCCRGRVTLSCLWCGCHGEVKGKNISIFRYSWCVIKVDLLRVVVLVPLSCDQVPDIDQGHLAPHPWQQPAGERQEGGCHPAEHFHISYICKQCVGVVVVVVVKIFSSYIFYTCHVHVLLCKKTSLVLVLF